MRIKTSVSMNYLLFGIMLLSVLDAVFTLSWIRSGIATEANPILDYLLSWGEEYFFAGKVFLTFSGCAILKFLSDNPLSRKAAISLTGFYGCLTLYHVIGAYLAVF